MKTIKVETVRHSATGWSASAYRLQVDELSERWVEFAGECGDSEREAVRAVLAELTTDELMAVVGVERVEQ